VFAIGRNTRKVAVLLGGLVVLGVSSPVSGGAGANDGLPIGRKPVKLDPADFTVKIDNPYYLAVTRSTIRCRVPSGAVSR
jgi:hypothetical protein